MIMMEPFLLSFKFYDVYGDSVIECLTQNKEKVRV